MSKASAKKKAKGRGKVIDSWKLKEWYEVYAPRTFKETFIGSIPSGNPENLPGRVIETLLYDITNNFRHTNLKLMFKVTEVAGNRCNTRFWGHELTRDFTRSLIHRGTSRIDGIFNFTTSDGFVYRVSTFVVTRRRAKKSQKHTIRKIIYDVLNEFASNMPHDEFVRGIIFGKFAANIKRIAKTIYPLRECQIRKVKVVSMPEGVEDKLYLDDEIELEEVDVNLPEHGKTVKANKNKKKRESDEGMEGESTENTGANSEKSESA